MRTGHLKRSLETPTKLTSSRAPAAAGWVLLVQVVTHGPWGGGSAPFIPALRLALSKEHPPPIITGEGSIPSLGPRGGPLPHTKDVFPVVQQQTASVSQRWVLSMNPQHEHAGSTASA